MNDNIYPDLILEQYLLGELPADQRQHLEQSLASNEELRARLDALRADNAAFHQQYPSQRMLSEIQRRDNGERRPAARRRQRVFVELFASDWFRPAATALSLSVIAVLVVTLQQETPRFEDEQDLSAPAIGDIISEIVSLDTDRSKGLSPGLTVYRRQGIDMIPMQSDEQVRAGDVLQLSYHAAGKPYGVILSLDGRGVVTLHYPLQADGDTTLYTKGEIHLDDAYQLDDAPDFERFIFVTADESVDVRVVLEQARQIAASGDKIRDQLALPSQWQQASIFVRKWNP